MRAPLPIRIGGITLLGFIGPPFKAGCPLTTPNRSSQPGLKIERVLELISDVQCSASRLA
jgi:hypothetical protein